MIRESRTDWNRLDGMPDSEIDFSEVPKMGTSFFRRAKLRMPKRKTSVSIRLDADVLNWFKRKGRGYQTRINAILRAFVEAHHDARGHSR
ncbi:MAG: BrnA antitoxin family protein [Chlamydiota bacterium]